MTISALTRGSAVTFTLDKIPDSSVRRPWLSSCNSCKFALVRVVLVLLAAAAALLPGCSKADDAASASTTSPPSIPSPVGGGPDLFPAGGNSNVLPVFDVLGPGRLVFDATPAEMKENGSLEAPFYRLTHQ